MADIVPAGAGVRSAPAPPAFFSAADKHALHKRWTYWELRAKDSKMGIRDWKEQPTTLFTFDNLEDFLAFWHRAPKITDVFERAGVEPMRIAREEPDRGGIPRTIETKSEAYMLFKEGIAPMTEFEVAPGVRATQNRRRAELSVSPRDFESWWKAWEYTVLALIGESIDPDDFVVGAYLTDKKSKGGVALRLEIWFSTKEDEVCDAIAMELARLLHEKLPDLPFRFQKPSYDRRKAAEVASVDTPTSGGGAVEGYGSTSGYNGGKYTGSSGGAPAGAPRPTGSDWKRGPPGSGTPTSGGGGSAPATTPTAAPTGGATPSGSGSGWTRR